MKIKSDNIKECRNQNIFFGLLSDDHFNDLIPYITIRSAKCGQFFSLSRNNQKRIIGVCQGMLKIVEMDQDGGEQFKFLAFEGDFFGGILNTSNDYAFVLSKEATFYSIEYTDMMNWLSRHPSLLKLYHESLAQSVQSIHQWYSSMLKMDVKARFLYLLKILARKDGTIVDNHILLNKKLTQGEMAVLLYTSRQSVVRVVNELRAEGKISYFKRRIEFAM